MELLSKIVFWVLIPLVIVYFRVKKKYGTAFALGMVATSLFFGLLASRSFIEKPYARVVRLMNENRYEDAKRELQYLLQKDPSEAQKIDQGKILNPVMYKRIKDDLSSFYLSVAGNIISKHEGKYDPGCGEEKQLSEKGNEITHALRLIEMAQSMGPGGDVLRNRALSISDRYTMLQEHLKKKCPAQ